MPNEHIVAQEGEIGIGERRIVAIGKLEIGVFNVDGEYYALPNVCLHQFGPLCEGRISGTLSATAASDWKLEWVNEGQIVTCRGIGWSSTLRPVSVWRFQSGSYAAMW